MARPLLASDIQPEDDAARILAEKRERRIRDAALAMLLALGGLTSGAAVLAALRRYDVRGVLSVLQGDDTERLLITGYQPIADLFGEAARQAANDNFGALVVYDPLASSSDLAALRAGFMSAVQRSQEQVVRETMVQALRAGASPEAVQAVLTQVVSLTPRDAAAVLNYRRLLERGDPGALERALRDKRFDATVQAMLRGDRALTAEQVDAMVGRYAQRMVAHRAETIAKTESMQAAVSGIRDAYVQAVKSGQLMESEVRRFWLVTADERTCEVCSSVPVLNRAGVGVDEPYDSAAGPIMAPLAHIRCRCSERYTANLSRLRFQPFRTAA